AAAAHAAEAQHTQPPGRAAPPRRGHHPPPPFLIGGAQPRMLQLAAREADIIGVNPAIRSGRIGAEASRDGVAARTDEKLAWVREAAGDRYGEIEINFLIYACVVTEDRPTALATMAPLFAVSPDEIGEYPHAWVGSIDQICERLQADRERWDASYLVVQGLDALDAAAPIVARLTGT